MFEQILSIIARKTYPPFPEGIPGPQTLATGNPDTGFFGEVAATDFINYADLATLIGLTTGTNPYTTGGWLKLSYNGKVQFIPKLPARIAVPWATLNTLGAVEGKEVTILGKTYKVRLINASNVNPYPNNSNNEEGMPQGAGTEWNRLIFGLVSSVVGAAALEGPALATYTLTQLGFDTGNGRSTIIKETTAGGLQIARGNASTNIRGIYPYAAVTATDNVRGWRPVIEYVSG